MSSNELLEQAMTLPKDERADMARKLLLSLEEIPAGDSRTIDEQWAKEIDRRLAAADANPDAEVDWQAAVARIRQSLK